MRVLAPLGAVPDATGTRFRLWAPRFPKAWLRLDASGDRLPMAPVEADVFEVYVPGVRPGARYRYEGDTGLVFPDPASRFQPDGVHGPSEVLDLTPFAWTDADWTGRPLRDLTLYELHIGTFTPEGTYDAARQRLPALRDLGVTALELMPLHDFPGRWGWGYDPAAFYAPCRAYGRPEDLQRFVDDAHRLGLSVFLDVVYNHLGPDGAYINACAPMLKEAETPWGVAINFDGAGADGVRAFFRENACYWLDTFHFDGLRLDATSEYHDTSPYPFLVELRDAVAALPGPPRLLIAEDLKNDRTVITPVADGGYGMDATWVDDLAVLMRHQLTGETDGHLADAVGSTTADLARTFERGWWFEGDRDSVRFGPAFGTSAEGLPATAFQAVLQTHDLVGNRPLGDRLHQRATPAAYRAASALLLFAPQTVLLWMGQEWGCTAPFPFFSDHAGDLGHRVTEGRKDWLEEYMGTAEGALDPQDTATFHAAHLNWTERAAAPHAQTLAFYTHLLHLRQTLADDAVFEAPTDGGLVARRGDVMVLVALRPGVTLPRPTHATPWFHSEEPRFAVDGVAPLVAAESVTFPTPGALWLRTA